MVAQAMTLGLSRLGHTVRHEVDGLGDLREATDGRDVVLLDIGLPGKDGFDVCREIRAFSPIPIVVLTARSDDIDTVVGLESGADDYVVKPATPRVLDARIKAVLRRLSPATSTNDGAVSDDVVEVRGLQIDRQALEVRKNGVVISLTPTEIRLVLALSDNRGRVLSRQQLLQAVWEQDYLGDSRIVDTAIQRLRGKIEDDAGAPTIIETVRGFGYRFFRS